MGSSCQSLQSGYYVCVGVPDTPTTRPKSAPPPTNGPSPQQSGIVSTCKICFPEHLLGINNQYRQKLLQGHRRRRLPGHCRKVRDLFPKRVLQMESSRRHVLSIASSRLLCVRWYSRHANSTPSFNGCSDPQRSIADPSWHRS